MLLDCACRGSQLVRVSLATSQSLRCAVYRLRSEEAAHLCVRAGAAAKRTEELGLVAFVPPFVDP